VQATTTGRSSRDPRRDAAFGKEILHVAVGQAVAQRRYQPTAGMITYGGNRNPAKLDRGAATSTGR
jgi:hypothetical protein